MGSNKKNGFSEKEDVVGLIARMGYKRMEAKMIAYFLYNERGSSAQIEKEMIMSKPQVSEAAKKMVKKGLLRVTSDKDGRGRPRNVYFRPKSISKDFLVNDLEISLLQQKENIEKRITSLRKLTKNM